MEIVFIIAQVILGLYFMMMGINHFKKSDMLVGYARQRGMKGAKPMTMLSGIVLLLCGLSLLLGAYTSTALWVLAAFLVAASFSIHHFWTDQDPMQKMNEMVNFMKNLALAAALIMMLAVPVSSWGISIF